MVWIYWWIFKVQLKNTRCENARVSMTRQAVSLLMEQEKRIPDIVAKSPATIYKLLND